MAAPSTQGRGPKPVEFSSKLCVMHVIPTTKSKFLAFTSNSWRKFVSFASKWRKFDCKEGNVVGEISDKLDLDFANIQSCIEAVPSTNSNVGYHYECYRRFCDVSKVKRKERSCSNEPKDEDEGTDMYKLDEGPVVSSTATCSTGEPSRKRVLRSESTRTPTSWSRCHMFAAECCLCHSNRYKRNRVTGKRSLLRLVTCELVHGGQLVEAARRKEDISLLQEIENEDLVAKELQYHHDCYKDYTRFPTRPSKPLTAIQNGYIEAFSQFSEDIIRKRILVRKEILSLSKLNKIFIRIIKEVDGVDAPYRTWNLKKRLQKKFPQLTFLTPSNRNMSDLVFSEHLSADDLAEDLLDNSTSTDSSTDEENSEIRHDPKSYTRAPSDNSHLYAHTLYNAALIVKSTITGNQKSPDEPVWPPTAAHLTLQQAKDGIPYQLFNFLAWLVGASTEPKSTTYVDVTQDKENKLISIAQDIVFLATKGKQVMPKHTALATAARHLTGSAKLIGILNGLGHSISHSSLMEHNTAIAKRQINLCE